MTAGAILGFIKGDNPAGDENTLNIAKPTMCLMLAKTEL
jgi:hypothetical protein